LDANLENTNRAIFTPLETKKLETFLPQASVGQALLYNQNI